MKENQFGLKHVCAFLVLCIMLFYSMALTATTPNLLENQRLKQEIVRLKEVVGTLEVQNEELKASRLTTATTPGSDDPACPCPPLRLDLDSDPHLKDRDDLPAAMAGLCDRFVHSSNFHTYAILPSLFCQAYPLVFRRTFSQMADRHRTHYSPHFFSGVHNPDHMQMAFEQYFAIFSVIMTIPSKNQTHGPNVLIVGCGSDTPMYTNLLSYLKGKLDFVDNSKEWADKCKAMGADDVHLLQFTGTQMDHVESMKNADGIHTPLNSRDFDQQRVPTPASLREKTYDVIVVDGPAGANQDGSMPGRSQSLFMARTLAESYPKDHYTHIFLHDTNRDMTRQLGVAILGHDPAVYLGNVRPTKGLDHWRIPGTL